MWLQIAGIDEWDMTSAEHDTAPMEEICTGFATVGTTDWARMAARHEALAGASP